MRPNDEQVESLKKWIDALRSGKYKQGTGQLKRSGKYCVFGVLCDCYAKSHKTKWKRVPETQEYLFMNERAFPPVKVTDWIGMNRSVMVPKIIAWNDCKDKKRQLSFSQIADKLEATLPKPKEGKTSKSKTKKRRRKTNAKK